MELTQKQRIYIALLATALKIQCFFLEKTQDSDYHQNIEIKYTPQLEEKIMTVTVQ
jgi:hypothetical protein